MTENLTAPVQTMLTPAMHSTLAARVAADGTSVSELLRALIADYLAADTPPLVAVPTDAVRLRARVDRAARTLAARVAERGGSLTAGRAANTLPKSLREHYAAVVSTAAAAGLLTETTDGTLENTR